VSSLLSSSLVFGILMYRYLPCQLAITPPHFPYICTHSGDQHPFPRFPTSTVPPGCSVHTVPTANHFQRRQACLALTKTFSIPPLFTLIFGSFYLEFKPVEVLSSMILSYRRDLTGVPTAANPSPVLSGRFFPLPFLRPRQYS